MLFRVSCETFRPAFDAYRLVSRGLEPLIDEAISRSTLSELDCQFLYVPIIMPAGMREHYPARSRLRTKQKSCECAPQLDYQVFVTGTLEQQALEYARGIRTMTPRLAELGVTVEQIAELDTILTQAISTFLRAQEDPTLY